jgi:hypothetical protein
MSVRALDRLGKLARMTRDLPRFLHTPLTSGEARRVIAGRLVQREQRFFALVGPAIYGWPASPYARLLKLAGCELGDLRQLVGQEGLEGALTALAERGVYLTFEEFKGQRPVVRGSQRFEFHERDFDNPLVVPHVEASSGGSRSRGTTVKMSLGYLADLAVNTRLAFDAHGLGQPAHVVWIQGNAVSFIYACLGQSTLAWFHPVEELRGQLRLTYHYLTAYSSLLGSPLPGPRYSPVEAPERLTEWLLSQSRPGQTICVTTYASSAVRICAAALERGARLEQVCFITLGEPFTEAKRRIVEAAGARALVRYAFTEAGIIGYACASPTGSDDLHFCADSYVLTQRRRPIGDSDLMVEAFTYSSLLPRAPKILLNVESGDTALLERRACSCLQGEAGLTVHLSQIRSFEKLSSEGMTFMHTDLLHVLEDELPARFGGLSSDYQVVEQEVAADGRLQLVLIVSPRVGAVDQDALLSAFLTALERYATFQPAAAQLWRQAGAVQVRRDWPLPTRAGKILPFHVATALQSATPPEAQLGP